MSWIAVSGQGLDGWVCPQQMDSATTQSGALLARGTILIETRISPEGRPQTLLAHRRTHPWPGQIALRVVPGGGIVLVLSQGDDVFHTVLQHQYEARTDILRVSFSWDSEARYGRLSVERPESDTVVWQDTPPPPPLLMADIRTLTLNPQLCETDKDLLFFAVSDQIEPVGPMPSLVPTTPVLTPNGYRHIGQLQCGDTVQTEHAGIIPVLHNISREVPGLGSFQPIRLRAPYFGLTRDLVVASQQRLVIGGTDVEYIFGREAVLIPAQSLVNGFAAVLEPPTRMLRYHQLLLPGHEAIISAEAQLETLYAGRLRRRRPLLGHTLLSDVPRNLLPEHTRAGLKVLRPFEAITLAEARAA